MVSQQAISQAGLRLAEDSETAGGLVDARYSYLEPGMQYNGVNLSGGAQVDSGLKHESGMKRWCKDVRELMVLWSFPDRNDSRMVRSIS